MEKVFLYEIVSLKAELDLLQNLDNFTKLKVNSFWNRGSTGAFCNK